jgi:hypothetical protein
MPELSTSDQAKLIALEQQFEAARQGVAKKPLYTEVVAVYWPEPVNPIAFCHTQIDALFGFEKILAALASYGITALQAKLITQSGQPFADLPQTAAISDDTVEYNISDLQSEISALCFAAGQGLQVRVFSYYPDVDLLLEVFTGTLRAPKDANGQSVKLSATAGYKSAKLLLPRRLPIPGCMFIFGGLLSSQEEIDLHKGCPYSRHLVAVPGVDPAYINNANGTLGISGAFTKTSGGDAWNCGAIHNVTVNEGDAAFDFTPITFYTTVGFSTTSSPRSGNTDFTCSLQFNFDGSVSIHHSSTQVIPNVERWTSADQFRIEIRSGQFRCYKGGIEFTPPGLPAPAYPLYIGLAIENPGAGISYGKVRIGEIGAALGIGLLDPSTGQPFTDCPRDSVTSCATRLGTNRFFPGFKTVIETLTNYQTKQPNLQATAQGNENTLTDPIRAIIGHRLLKGLRLLTFRPENDNNHPEKGWVAFIFEIAEGTFFILNSFTVNNVPVGIESLNLRYGDLGQAPTSFSPNIDTYSGTAVGSGRIQGDFRNAKASDLSATIHAYGPRDVRVYADLQTFIRTYTTNPAWGLLEMLTNKRWGFGEDYGRYDIQSFIDVAAEKDEEVSVTDPNGNVFAGTRSTCNVELTGRATQTQIEDFCIAHRISPPFEHNGKKMIVSLQKEEIDDDVIPYLTDIGPDVNVCADAQGRSLVKYSYIGDDELPNQYTVAFDDGTNGFTSTPLVFGDMRQQLAAGKAWGDTTIKVIPKEIPAFGVIWMQEAARLGNSLLILGPLDRGGTKNNLSVQLTTWFSQCFEIRIYKLVRVRLRALEELWNRIGFEAFSYFRVLGKKRKGNLQVELTLQAYPVDYYEHMETVIDHPGASPGVNPGGGPGDRPCSIPIEALSHTNSTIELELGTC